MPHALEDIHSLFIIQYMYLRGAGGGGVGGGGWMGGRGVGGRLGYVRCEKHHYLPTQGAHPTT
jgi:hypothetical protein